MKTNRPRTRRQPRPGTIYLLVLYTSFIVATIGLGALLLMRVQGQAAEESTDFDEARTYARAAIEIGMLKIRNDPDWRTNLGNGNWVTNQPIGSGTFSVSAADPLDNDVTKGDNHPVVLTGTGVKGRARYQTSARLEVGPRTGSCLEVSLISGENTNVKGAVLTSDQTVSANRKYSASGGAIVNAVVEAHEDIGGSTYMKATVEGAAARDMPDPSHAFDYYLANGTTIQYTDLTRWSASEILTNTSFELDASGWYAYGGTCVLQQSSAQASQGVYSLLVKSRATANAVAAQDVPVGLIGNGNTYQLSMPVLPTAACTAQAVLTLTSSGSGVQKFSTPLVTLSKGARDRSAWTDLNGKLTPTWTGSLTKATVSISMSVKNRYYLDNVSLVDVTYPNGSHVLDRQLLGPSVNPYGSGQTNSQGIYMINCAGQNVVIGRARIVGTLVLLQPGSGSLIQGPVIWEPARYNFPALLANGTIQIGANSALGVDEISIGVNLNPPGTPYPYPGGVANTTLTDAYPGKITGIVYSSQELNFSGAANIFGVVIADRKIDVNATSLNLSYGNTYLNDPPPGFDFGTIHMQVVPGTWRRSVN